MKNMRNVLTSRTSPIGRLPFKPSKDKKTNIFGGMWASRLYVLRLRDANGDAVFLAVARARFGAPLKMTRRELFSVSFCPLSQLMLTALPRGEPYKIS